MTFSKILNASEALSRLSEEKLSIKEAVALSRIIKKISEELEIFSKLRGKLLEEYGKFDEKKGEFAFSDENGKIFNEKMKELLEEKIEGKIEPLRLESEVSITAADVLRLEGLVEFE